jgi:hypothetical protein
MNFGSQDFNFVCDKQNNFIRYLRKLLHIVAKTHETDALESYSSADPNLFFKVAYYETKNFETIIIKGSAKYGYIPKIYDKQTTE